MYKICQVIQLESSKYVYLRIYRITAEDTILTRILFLQIRNL